jgi:prepilin-type N-terminal cleavage/methylation domain-containing protein
MNLGLQIEPRKRARGGKSRIRAFTLIELMAVVLVLAILVGATLAAARYVGERAKASRARAEIAALEAAIEAFKAENGYYPTTTVYRLSYVPYLIQTNSWMLYQQLTTGPRKYINLRPDQISSNSMSGIPFIVDPWGSPIVYYAPRENVPYEAGFEVLGDYAVVTNRFTKGGQVNSASFDLFSYGPDQMTFVPGAPAANWGNAAAANDDIGNFHR